MKNVSLIDKDEWEELYTGISFQELDPNNFIKLLIQKILTDYHIPAGAVFEVGCYPGWHLAIFGNIGFELNGIDFVDDIEIGMKKWLENKKYRVGKLIKGDFFRYKDNKQYDFVYSLGFIEHFRDIETDLLLHTKLVKPGGYLLIGVPNFRGLIQRLLHLLLDYKSYMKHNIQAMDMDKWQVFLEKQDFEILEKKYVRGFDYWVGDQKRNKLQNKLLVKLGENRKKLQATLTKPNPIYSPYSYILAQKRV